MKNNPLPDEYAPRREKENMDQPQEEFISDDPPSRSKEDDPKESEAEAQQPTRDE